MVITVVACVLAVWLLSAVVVAFAVGRAAHLAEVTHRDQAFLRDVERVTAALNRDPVASRR